SSFLPGTTSAEGPRGVADPARRRRRGSLRPAIAIPLRRSPRSRRAPLRRHRGAGGGPRPARRAGGVGTRAVAAALEGPAGAAGAAGAAGGRFPGAAGALDGCRRAPPGPVPHRTAVIEGTIFLVAGSGPRRSPLDGLDGDA